MKIYKIVSDSRPSDCLVCPINRYRSHKECGAFKEIDIGDGWTSEGYFPDERCKFEVIEI